MVNRHRTPGGISAFQIILGIWVLIAVGIIAAVLFAPEKTPAPPTSTISYEPPPSPARGDTSDLPDKSDTSDIRPARRNVKPSKDPEKPKGDYVIHGAVTDADTGDALTWATVHCLRVPSKEESAEWEAKKAALSENTEQYEKLLDGVEALHLKAHANTQKEGEYALDVPLPGHYWVTAFCNGYIRQTGLEVQLDEATRKVRLDISMSRGASISGTVTESGTRQGAAKVQIYAQGAKYRQEAVTGPDGTYQLTGFAPGDYRVALGLRGVAYTVVGSAPVRNVTVKDPTEKVTGVDFTVEPAGMVWGYVLDRDRKPVENVGVILCTSASVVSQALNVAVQQKKPVHGGSRADGYYELIGVPLNQEWRIHTITEGRHAGKVAPQLTDPFMLNAYQRTVRIDIFVQPGSRVQGRVLSTDRIPIQNADVVCVPAYSKFFAPLDSPQTVNEARSDVNGYFEVAGLPGGEYQILAQKQGFKFAAMGEKIYPDGYSDLSNVVVTLTPVDVGQYSVYGTVTDTRGRTIEGARLSLVAMSSENLAGGDRDVISDAKGYYVFTGVDPGILILHAEKEGYTEKTVTRVFLDEPTDIGMEAAAGVSGKVLVRETKAPAESFTVRAMPKGGSGGGFLQMMGAADSKHFSGPDGSFQMALASGSYTLEARAPGMTPGRTDVTVKSGEHVDGVVIMVSEQGGKIEGRVVTADSKSPQGALVTIMPEGSMAAAVAGALEGMERAAQVGEDGRFEFGNLAEGTYIVMARLAGYAQGRSAPVSVEYGRSAQRVEVFLGQGGRLQGYVSIDGKLKPGAIVAVVGSGVTDKMTTSDQNGQYLIEGIPAGRYLASAVSVDGASFSDLFSPLHAKVEILDGQTTIHNFGEETGATVAGYCSPPPPSSMLGPGGVATLMHPWAAGCAPVMNLDSIMNMVSGGDFVDTGVVGLEPVQRDGYFAISNVPEGTFVLEVTYINPTEILAGGGKPGFSTTVTVTGQERVDLGGINVSAE